MHGRMIDRLARLAQEVERAATPENKATATATFLRACRREPVALAGAVLELYRAAGHGSESRQSGRRADGPLSGDKLTAAAALFDAKARKAMRGASGDPVRAAELLWTWGRQDRGFGDAMIRLFLVSWP